MARLCCVRELNARTRVRQQACVRGSLERGGGKPSSEAEPARGGVSPQERRNPLEGALDWATPVGRGGHRGVGRALCVRSSKRCVLF
jgi:hypothetical protein